MVAVNSLTDRLIEQMCQYGGGEIALNGGSASQGYRVYHLPFESCDSVLDGSLALSLSSHLRCIAPRMQGNLNVRLSCENLWDVDRCRVRVEVYEVYATKEEADQRQRELLRQRNSWFAQISRRLYADMQRVGQRTVEEVSTVADNVRDVFAPPPVPALQTSVA